MPLNARSLGLGAAVTAAIIYTVCSLFVALFPSGTSTAFSYVFHLDFTAIARPITWGSYCVGVVSIAIAIGVMIALAAAFYNRFTGDSTVHP